MNMNKFFRICIFILLFNILSISIVVAVPWADTGNLYRQEINMTGATSNLDNLTHEFTINSGNVGTNFNFVTDRDSVRFYYYNNSSNTNTLIPHYANVWNSGGSTADIMIKIPFVSSTQDANIWMYYRNSTKTNVEDYCSVFIYCDLFDDASIDSRLTTTDQDLVAGTTFSEGSGELTIVAGGDDTWTGDDEYGSVFVDNVFGNVDVRLAVTSITNTNPWTKSGIMIKNDMTAAASSTGYVFNIWRPVNGYSFQTDSDSNGFLNTNNAGSSTSVPDYVRIVKDGTSFTAYQKTSNVASWSTITTATVGSALTTQDIGISLTSHAGTTLATSTYDNFTIQRHTTDTISETFGVEERLVNNLEITVNEPSTSTINNVLQNTTLEYNITISCVGIDPSGCSTVSAEIFRNNTPSATSISTSSSTPIWTSSTQPQSCGILNVGSSCNLTWTLNVTGLENEQININSIASSSNSNISNFTSENVTIRVVLGNTVSFNQSSFIFNNFAKDSGNEVGSISVISDNGNNTNIVISCESGDCGTITDNWVDGINLNEGIGQSFTFICLDDSSGTYSAIYNVTSDEFDGKSTITVSCTVDPIFGPINGTIISPIEGGTIQVGQNKTFNLQARVDCTGLCGNITAYALSGRSDWFDTSFGYRQAINISVGDATPINYQILLNLTGSLGSNFNWANNCNDIRFANISNELDYWIETCNTSSNELLVWIESDIALSASSNYLIDLYYGDSSAVSRSNVSATFRNDEIHLVTGRCLSSNAACNQMDNAAEADTIRSIIDSSGSYSIDGTGYVSQINDPSNPYGADDNYYSRYRALWIPSSSGSFSFGTASDDGSDVGLWNYDGYGFGLSTPTSISNHDIVSFWYGGHGTGTCGSSAATELTRSINAGVGYWIDYVMTEVGGGQDAEFCINTGSGYNNFGTTSFSGEIFSRNYVENEPSISNVGVEENLAISTTLGDTPLWTSSAQPQSCIPLEDGSCLFTWSINATGAINSSELVNVIFESNLSTISDSITGFVTVNITNNAAPTITLLEPVNNSKIINSGTIDFTWIVNDDETNTTCRLYIDNVVEFDGTCDSGVNSSFSASLSYGEHTWFVEAIDSLNQSINSSVNRFVSILNYSLRVEKEITSENLNQYLVNTTITDYVLNETYTYDYVDYIPNNFIIGSITPTFSFFNLTSGANYNGRIYVWNLNTTTSRVTYALSGVGDYEVSELFMIGGGGE